MSVNVPLSHPLKEDSDQVPSAPHVAVFGFGLPEYPVAHVTASEFPPLYIVDATL